MSADNLAPAPVPVVGSTSDTTVKTDSEGTSTTLELVVSSPPRGPSFLRPLGTNSTPNTTPESSWVYTNSGSSSRARPLPLPIPVPLPMEFTPSKDPELECMDTDMDAQMTANANSTVKPNGEPGGVKSNDSPGASPGKGFFPGGFVSSLKRLPRAMIRRHDGKDEAKQGNGYGHRKLPSIPRFRRATADTTTSASTLPRYEINQTAPTNDTVGERPVQAMDMPIPLIAESPASATSIPDQLLTAPALSRRHSSDNHSQGQRLSVHNVALHDFDESSYVHVDRPVSQVQRVSYASGVTVNSNHHAQPVDAETVPVTPPPSRVGANNNILPTSDYAVMSHATPTTITSPSFSAGERDRPRPPREGHVQKFFQDLSDMPWISAERVTVDYRPGVTRLPNGKMVKLEKPLKSWYTSQPKYDEVDLFSDGVRNNPQSPNYAPTIRPPRRPHRNTVRHSDNYIGSGDFASRPASSSHHHNRPAHQRSASSPQPNVNRVSSISGLNFPTPTTPRQSHTHTRRESSQGSSPPISPVYPHHQPHYAPSQPGNGNNPGHVSPFPIYTYHQQPQPLYFVPSPPPSQAGAANNNNGAGPSSHGAGAPNDQSTPGMYVLGTPGPYPYQYYTPPYAISISTPPPVHVATMRQASASG